MWVGAEGLDHKDPLRVGTVFGNFSSIKKQLSIIFCCLIIDLISYFSL